MLEAHQSLVEIQEGPPQTIGKLIFETYAKWDIW